MHRSMWAVSIAAVFFLLAASACQMSPNSDSVRMAKFKVPTCS
jgi:cytochrome c556